jgi:hypothetical protein
MHDREVDGAGGKARQVDHRDHDHPPAKVGGIERAPEVKGCCDAGVFGAVNAARHNQGWARPIAVVLISVDEPYGKPVKISEPAWMLNREFNDTLTLLSRPRGE